MAHHVPILRRVALVLFALGAIDIGLLIFCVANDTSYSSGSGIIAAVAGICLIRGSLKAARTTSQVVAVLLALLWGGVILSPLLFSPGLLLAYLRLRPVPLAIAVAALTVSIVALTWVYRSLTAPAVRAAMDEAKVSYRSFWRRPATGFWIGGVAFALLAVLVLSMLHGQTGRQAEQRAAAQLGPGYDLHVKYIHVSHSGGSRSVCAIVTAYNDEEINDVWVAWSE